jgi:hypothetical protein
MKSWWRAHSSPMARWNWTQKPNLSPGRVTVVLRQQSEPPPPKENWWQYLQRSRRELEASGAKFMSEEELKAHQDWLREPDRIDEMLRQANEEHGQQEPL